MIRRRLLTGTLSNCAGRVVAIGAWFFLTPFVLSTLGSRAYALWVLVGAIASYGMLLEGGFGGAVIKYVAEHVARHERGAAAALVASAVWLYSVLAVLAVGLSLLLGPVLPPLLNIDPDQYRTATWLIILTGVNIACAIATTPASAVLRGLHRYDLHNAVIALNAVTEASLVAAVLFTGGGLLGMMLALIAANLTSGVASILLVARIAPDLHLRFTGGSSAAFRRLLVFSTALFPIEAGRRLQNRTDGFVIAAFQGLAGVTPFALARRLSELCELAAVQFLRVVLPVASELHAGDDRQRLRHLYLVSSRVALAISMPVAVTLMVAGPTILTMWVGSAYASDAYLLMLLAPAAVLATSQWPAAEVLQGMNRHRLVGVTSCVSGVASILLSILLLPWLGLMGVAVGACVPIAMASLLVVTPFACRILHVSAGMMLREVWLPALVPSGAAALVLAAITRDAAISTYGRFATGLACSAVAYGALYFLMPATGAERRLLKDGWVAVRAFPRLISIRATQ
jgi:O-antigen/teichoic acid export membrane protein